MDNFQQTGSSISRLILNHKNIMNLQMDSLFNNPLFQSHDLGRALPSWPNATSVCLPRWDDNVDYEKNDPRVVQALACGYPRFVIHPYVKELGNVCARKWGNEGEFCLVFPSLKTARCCARFMLAKSGIKTRIKDIGFHGLHGIFIPNSGRELAKSFWTHAGEGISPRCAWAALNGFHPDPDAALSKEQIRERIASHSGCSTDHVFLYPSGMAALFNIYQELRLSSPRRKSVQYGFPYVDTYKIQEKFGVGVRFFSADNPTNVRDLSRWLRAHKIMGLFTEFPMNPLLTSPDLQSLNDLAGQYGFPLIVDDTLGTWENLAILKSVDAVTSSLTKYFSGAGDVMGGVVVINPQRAAGRQLLDRLKTHYEDNLWPEDAVILEENSRDFKHRLARINRTAELVADQLNCHPAIARLYYPKFIDREYYDAWKLPTGGYGGVMSVVVREPEHNAAKFFDALPFNKGPSLGTNFTLACPYTILAHYHEMDFAEQCGISRYLIRISVGLEDADVLISRLHDALNLLQ